MGSNARCDAIAFYSCVPTHPNPIEKIMTSGSDESLAITDAIPGGEREKESSYHSIIPALPEPSTLDSS